MNQWIVIVDSPFLPARGGGEREHCGLIEAAADAGHLALVVMPAEQATDLTPYRDMLGETPLLVTPLRRSPLHLAQQQPYGVASRPVPHNLARMAHQLAPQADGVIVSSWKSWRLGERLAHDSDLPTVLRMHNREGDYHRALALGSTNPMRWVWRREARKIACEERALAFAPWLSGIADISLSDAHWRRGFASVPVDHVAPFAAVHTASFVRAPAPEPTVTFMGALDVATNTEALTWFARAVWPSVLRDVPDARFVVVGRRPPSSVRSLIRETPSSELHADVPDMTPYLEASHVSVNPAISGSGVNIKLVDSLAAGVPTVSTSRATCGLDVRPGVDLLVEDEPWHFARAVTALLRDTYTAEQIGAQGRQRLLATANPGRGIDQLATLLATRAGWPSPAGGR